MMMACHGVGPGCTVIGADDACGGMWTAWAGAAVTGFPSVGVTVASPWTVRRRWWRPVGSAQVVVGSVIEWRRMAWSPWCDFVPSECAVVDRPFPWQVSKPVSVRGGAVLWGKLHCGDGVGEGLCAGFVLCGWW